MTIYPVRAEFFHADRLTDTHKHTDRQTKSR